jgi:5-methylcytosine-specific restriction enzyme A
VVTYLFAWNPKRWAWENLDEEIERVSVVGYVDDRWSCGNTKAIPVGSRVFLIRLGVEPKGIIGSGITLSTPELGPHWDLRKAAVGREAPFVDIRFDCLSRDVLVTWKELQGPPFAKFRWGIQSSGVTIPTLVADALQVVWDRRVGGTSHSAPGVAPSSSLPEGAKRRITVNAYERNSYARAACISHHGVRCRVCDVDLGERFGKLAKGFIHVHHVVPIATIGREYEVDPLKDLVPVCPTCHAVLHLRAPPLLVDEARELLKKAEK